MKIKPDRKELFSDRYRQIYEITLGADWIDKAKNNIYSAFRINTTKYKIQDITKLLDGNKDYGIFEDKLLILSNDLKGEFSSKLTDKQDMGFFLNMSSLIPPSQIDIKENQEILDICAAPGIKTAQIYLKYKENFKDLILTANEKDQKRFYKLNTILDTLFEKNQIKTLQKDAKLLSAAKKYDQILCDVPCSAEGELIQDNNFSHWSSKLINSYTNTQKAILAKAIALLKDGGKIIYSTCTLAPEENEEVLDWALKKFDITLDNVNLEEFGIYNPITLPGLGNWGKKTYDKNIKKALRICPNDMYEGFFIAVIRKK